MTSGVHVLVNGSRRELAGEADVHALATELGVAEKKGVAIAIDGSVVPRKQWAGRRLVEGEKVLVIQATQGG